MTFDLSKPITDFSGFTLAELGSLRTQALAAARVIATKPREELSQADLDSAATLRTIVEGEAQERQRRTELAQQVDETLKDLPLDEQPPAEEKPADPAPVEQPADPPAEPAPADKPAEQRELAGVTAGATGARPSPPRVGQVAQGAPAVHLNREPEKGGDGAALAKLLKVDADGAAEFTSWLEVAKVAERRLSTYSGLRSNQRHGVAVIKKEFPADRIAEDDSKEALPLLIEAGKESNLPGGSLTAAAGWCAPSQTVYDLCELETTDGLVDVPEIQISRGGLRYTPGPDFASIFGGSGYFHQTEAQVIANTTKPCMEIPCPSFIDERLQVDGVCVTGSILQRRGYPELVERFIRGTLVAHVHKLNAWKIAAMVTGSTLVNMATLPEGSPVVEDSGTTGLLAALELQIVDIRYRHRMGLNQTVEAVAPAWLKLVIRADLSRRTGVELTNVTDEMIRDHFARRGARVQWVYDWQDAYSGLPTGPGGATPLTALPANVSVLLYPAGTWVAGMDDVIRLDTIYDSTLLSTNRYTALFTEEGILMAKPCGESRMVTFPLCPTGATGATVAFNCATE